MIWKVYIHVNLESLYHFWGIVEFHDEKSEALILVSTFKVKHLSLSTSDFLHVFRAAKRGRRWYCCSTRFISRKNPSSSAILLHGRVSNHLCIIHVLVVRFTVWFLSREARRVVMVIWRHRYKRNIFSLDKDCSVRVNHNLLVLKTGLNWYRRIKQKLT